MGRVDSNTSLQRAAEGGNAVGWTGLNGPMRADRKPKPASSIRREFTRYKDSRMIVWFEGGGRTIVISSN